MKQARAFQTAAAFCLLIILPYTLFADMKLSVKVINTGKQSASSSLVYTARLHEIVGLEISAFFYNTSAVETRTAILRGSGVDDMLHQWQNMLYRLSPGGMVTLSDTLYFRISSASPLHLSFQTEQRDPGGSIVTGETIYPVNVTISVDTVTAGFPLPAMRPDTLRFSDDFTILRYSAGTATSFQWRPAEINGDILRIRQDAYRFALDNPLNLQKAVSGVYKSAADSVRYARFDGLGDGRTYGYYIKADYETAAGAYTLYSDIWYSTQDNTPPASVASPTAVLDQNHKSMLIWLPVADVPVNGRASGVASYVISRSLDTGPERAVDTVDAVSGFVWRDTALIKGVRYHYRVRAVDAVGNTGDGAVSNSVFWDGEDEYPDNGGDDGTVTLTGEYAGGFITGSIDTLSSRLEGWEQMIRFVAAREDTSFFDTAPPSAMQLFDSGWITPGSAPADPADPALRYWIFNYARNTAANQDIDLNFVDNHRYLRRLYRRDVSGTVSYVTLPPVVPDCLPPADIGNLEAHSELVTASGFERYDDWQVSLRWSPANDGASGVARYRLFRYIQGYDPGYIEIAAADTILENAYTDNDFPAGAFLANAAVSYKVIAEDFSGNARALSDARRQATVSALKAPDIRFEGEGANLDTLFTWNSSVAIRLANVRHADASAFIVRVNGIETEYGKSSVTAAGESAVILNAGLDPVRLSRITCRVIYAAGRSSVWTEPKTVSQRNIPPTALSRLERLPAYNEWEGNIYLQWLRGSLDNRRYEVWRSENGSDWTPVDTTVVCDSDTIRWADRYGIDELSGLAGDTLTVYRSYFYKVRMVSELDEKSDFTGPVTAVCDKPPDIVSDLRDTVNSAPAIRINWRRPRPSDASGSWRTRVYVYLDSEEHLIDSTGTPLLNDVIDDTTFIYPYVQDPENDHNYIFRLYEEVTNPVPPPATITSALSMPRTVKLVTLDSLFVIAQPHGRIYIDWGEDPLLDILPVAGYRIERYAGEAFDTAIPVSASERGYMDAGGLKDRQIYTYVVSVINTLGQVMASGSRSAVCDFGRAFIPDHPELESRYFQPRTIDVGWGWYDQAGRRLSGTTQGAKELRIQASASADFPDQYSTDTGWFPADTLTYRYTVDVPPVIDSNNEKVYIRMTARDRWHHPDNIIWSETVYAIFDTLKPVPVTSTGVSGVIAYYGRPNTVMVTLSWRDESVLNDRQFPANANVARYEVVRRKDNTEWIAGYTPVTPQVTAYAFTDTVENSGYAWRIISIDSAGNRMAGTWRQFTGITRTPDAPVPDSTKSCSWTPIAPADSMEYFVELATSIRHFSWAYELGIDEPDNNVLCRSGTWLRDTRFACTSGWGSITSDTTWFRVKARQIRTRVESGWSVPSFRLNTTGGTVSDRDGGGESGRPDDFTLYQNYPNPFNSGTTIAYDLPEQSHVTVTVYNMQGKRVVRLVSEEQPPGRYRIAWEGGDEYGNPAASGIYIGVISARPESGPVQERRIKMSVVK
ncbi:T9SS type A sorting domain-containing protein [bacterium]|nr:T9SS type A sorting domain-containing protein [bacterium]